MNTDPSARSPKSNDPHAAHTGENTPAINRIVLSEQDIQKKIEELGAEITRDYADKELVMVCVLKGTLYFFADLTRHVKLPAALDFMAVGVYPGTTNQTGVVRITKDLDIDITGKHVLVVEGIVRTGLTIGYLVQNMQARRPASIKVCTLLDNPGQRLVNVPVAYRGFEVPGTWMLGYGMDIHEKWRNLPYIAEVERKD
jgi:hypoxanthine phosphoribosyltransferase